MSDVSWSVRRYVITAQGERVEITNCFWCGDSDTWICALCADKAHSREVSCE